VTALRSTQLRPLTGDGPAGRSSRLVSPSVRIVPSIERGHLADAVACCKRVAVHHHASPDSSNRWDIDWPFIGCTISMEVKFSPAKDRGNRHKHGLSLKKAEWLDWDEMIAWIDDSQDYGEERWTGIAPLGRDLLHTVVFVEMDEAIARVISLRRSTNQEIQTYAAQKGRK
jgi:uncharacterized DUF497 family protein